MVRAKRRKFPRPKARKIPLDSVTDFLKKKGYKVVKIERLWRHVTAVVEKDSQQLFFKMATTIKTGKMTENEFNWNEKTGSQLSSKTPFLVPKNIEKGFFQKKLFFFISDYFGNQTLANQYPPKTKQLNKWIPKIARAVYLINQIDCQPKDEQKNWVIVSPTFDQQLPKMRDFLKIIKETIYARANRSVSKFVSKNLAF